MDFKKTWFLQSSINGAVVSGILGFLIQPFVFFGNHFPDLGVLAWVFLLPLLMAIHRHTFTHKWILSFFCSLITHYGLYFWLITAMQKFGGLNFFQAFAVMSILCIVLSAVWASFLALCSWIRHFVKIPYFILLPVFLVVQDQLVHYIPFQGFPWGITPYSQGGMISYFQWVDVTGVHGLGFLIYLINGLLADGLLFFVYHKQLDKLFSRILVSSLLLVVSLYVSSLSNRHYEQNKTLSGQLSLALIQGNISQDIKWDAYQAQDHLNKYLQLTHNAVKNGADVVIWPETAYPYGLRLSKLATERFLDRESIPFTLFFGGIVSDKNHKEHGLYNSVLHVNQEAKYVGAYHKQHLVPFGEYLPLKSLFGFMESITQGVGEFDEGDGPTLFSVNGIHVAPLICFEDIFPRYTREFVEKSANLIVNFTNDAWYGDTSAQHQHLVFSQFRALENRRWMVRATNTGMTAVINPRGQVVSQLIPFTEDYLLENLTLFEMDSFYTKNGDRWVVFVIVLCALIVVYSLAKYRLGPVKIEF